MHFLIWVHSVLQVFFLIDVAFSPFVSKGRGEFHKLWKCLPSHTSGNLHGGCCSYHTLGLKLYKALQHVRLYWQNEDMTFLVFNNLEHYAAFGRLTLFAIYTVNSSLSSNLFLCTQQLFFKIVSVFCSTFHCTYLWR